MSDPQMVRFPCTHNQWFRHPVNPRDIKWEWCDGGETRWLVLYQEAAPAGTDNNVYNRELWFDPGEYPDLPNVWVEHNPPVLT